MIWKRCIPLLENWSRCLRRGNCGKAKRPGVDKAQNQVHTNTNWHTGCSCSFSIHCAKKIFSLWPFFVHRGKGYTRCCELGLLGDAVTSLQQARCVSDRDTVSDSAQNWSSWQRLPEGQFCGRWSTHDKSSLNSPARYTVIPVSVSHLPPRCRPTTANKGTITITEQRE